MVLPDLYLNRHQDKRLKEGHVWIFSNEIDVKKTPLSAFRAGELVQVVSFTEQPLGLATINPHTLLCARLLTTNCNQVIDQAFFAQRIEQALQMRNTYFAEPFYRLIFGESDALPGLVVDRYGDYLVGQISTAGMETFKEEITTALQDVLRPKGILWKNDQAMRVMEGLPQSIEVASGQIPDFVEIRENGTLFQIAPALGQKTGWFYDHRDSRALLQKMAPGKRVLDLFSYAGGWSIAAAVAGAAQVTAIDSSAQAIAWLENNAAINQVSDRISTQIEDVFTVLKHFQAQQQRFDIVILDPPAFIKKRKDLKTGTLAYQRINELAMNLVAENGILISSSCSLHLPITVLTEIVLRSSIKLKRHATIIAQGHQGLDHPIHPAIAETNYLKTLFCHVQ